MNWRYITILPFYIPAKGVRTGQSAEITDSGDACITQLF